MKHFHIYLHLSKVILTIVGMVIAYLFSPWLETVIAPGFNRGFNIPNDSFFHLSAGDIISLWALLWIFVVDRSVNTFVKKRFPKQVKEMLEH